MKNYTLASITTKGKDLLISLRTKDKKLILKKITNRKPYFYALKKGVNNNMNFFEKEENLIKIETDHPGDIPKLRNEYGDYTYESDVLYDIAFTQNTKNIFNPTIKLSYSFIDIENLMYKNGEKKTINELMDEGNTITAITRLDTLHKKIFVYVLKEFDKKLIEDTIRFNKKTKFNKDFKDKDIKQAQKIFEEFDLILMSFENEKQLLTKFVEDFNEYKTDIVTGWNVFYDYSVILKRLEIYGLLNKFSYFENEMPSIRKDGNIIKVYSPGYNVIDYMEIYKKRIPNRMVSYTLDYITNYQKTAFTKIKHKYKNNFDDFWRFDRDLFVYYNIVDVLSLYLLEHKLKLLDLSVSITNKAKIPVGHCNTNRLIVDGYILQELHKLGLRRITKHEKPNDMKKIGAFVDANIKYHQNYIISSDATSLYPSIFISLNISPETYIRNINLLSYYDEDYLKEEISKKMMNVFKEKTKIKLNKISEILYKEKIINEKYISLIDDYIELTDIDDLINNLIFLINEKEYEKELKNNNIVSSNGSVFTQEKIGILPNILEKLFYERKKHKNMSKEYARKYEQTNNEEYKELSTIYDLEQKTEKTILNSIYGVLLDSKYSLFHKYMGESITSTGQHIIKTARKAITDNVGNDKIALTDTDSVYYIAKKTPNKPFNINDEIDIIVESIIESYKIGKIIDEYEDNLMYNKIGIKNRKHWISFKVESLSRNILVYSKKKYALLELLEEKDFDIIKSFNYDENKIREFLLSKKFNLSIDDMEVKGMEIKKSSTMPLLKKYISKLIHKLLYNEITKEEFIIVVDKLWELIYNNKNKIDIVDIATMVRFNKEPENKNKFWYAMEYYNKTHEDKIYLGDTFYYFPIKSKMSFIVCKTVEEIYEKKEEILSKYDWIESYKTNYEKMKNNLLECLK